MNLRATFAEQATDVGLSRHMQQVFNYMTGGVALTGFVAWFMGSYNGGQLVYSVITSGLMWPLIIAQIGVVFFLAFRIQKMQPSTALAMFGGYSALSGVTIAPMVFAYTQTSVAVAFFTAATMFAAMAFYGYTTKRNLSAFKTFFIMGIVGLLAAMVINIFVQSDGMGFIISLIAVPLFAGVTAWDTQKIKELYYQVGSNELVRSRMAIFGALQLYIDFIIIFQHLLHLFGDRR